MLKDYTICVGTIGGGMSVSPDGGDTWNRVRDPMPTESNVRAFAVDPNDPHYILAGSDSGVFSSRDNGTTWEKLESPIDGTQIWSMAIDSLDLTLFSSAPNRMLFGPRTGESGGNSCR